MPGNETRKEILFVREADARREHWNGHSLTAGEASAASGIETPKTAMRAANFIAELFHKNREVSYIRAMAVDPELLEILACPNCKTPVTLIKNGTALKCGTCKRVYPIKDDIPVMLIDEATIEE